MTKTPRKSSQEIKEETALKKAEELSTLCGIEVCMISYGVNGEMKIFPEDRERVAAMASRFTLLSEASRSKKSTSLDDVLKDIHSQKMKKTKTKEKKVVDVDPNLLGSHFDCYSVDELSRKLESIRRKIQSIQEYRENMKKIDHGNLDPEVQSVGGIPKTPSTEVRIPEREGIITFDPIARNNCLVSTVKITVYQKVHNSSSYHSQNYQIKQKKIDYGNIASSSAAASSSPPDLGFQSSKKIDYGNIASSSSSFPPDLGFENSNSNNIFDGFDEFILDPNFGFDLKEVDYLLAVEEET